MNLLQAVAWLLLQGIVTTVIDIEVMVTSRQALHFVKVEITEEERVFSGA